MNSYVNSVFFAVVFVLIAWDIASGFAPQGSITINKAANSASFIQQESNQNVPITTPKTSFAISVTQRPLNNRGGTRDYVNPQQNPVGQPSKPQTQNLGSSYSSPTTTTITPVNIQNRGGVRDYVNPNLGKPISTTTPNPNPRTNSNTRDYVAPRSPRPEFPNLPSSQQNQKNPTPNFVDPNIQNRFGVRDYVNPNLGKPISTTTSNPNPRANSNTRDYVAPRSPKPEYPSLPSPQQNQTNPTPNFVDPNIQNRFGIRDYVNPNLGKPVSTTTPNPNPRANSNTRDYVAPRSPRPEYPSLPSPQQNQKNPTPNFVDPNIQNRWGVRDYVNPNLGKLVSTTTPNPVPNLNPRANSNTRDYVAPRPPRPEFPGLPSTQQNQKNPTPNFPALPATTPISYANKAAGGATTKPPLATSASAGPPTTPSPASSTAKPDEGPTDAELREFSEALLRRDVNNAAKYVSVNLQGKTTSQSQNDEAPQKLLDVNPEAFQIPTISKLKLLHNNYILETNENEHVTAQEKAEENDLLEAMLTTPIMQFTKNFLIAKGKISKDPKEFKDLLKILWFNMYSRGGGRIGSSGFEHIFLAELKKNEVSGLHNWVYFDHAEISKTVDYLGYMKKIDLGEKGAILKFHFKLNGVDKPVDSMFIGTSPELEVALYTTCYLFRADRVCPLRLNGNNFIIRTYNFRYRGKNMIGSAFPEI